MVCLFIYCPCLGDGGDVGDSDASGADLLTAASGLFTHASFSARFSHADGLFIATQWGTADAEYKAPSVENPELTKFNVLPLKPVVGQNIATHASPTARNIFVVFFTAPAHSPSFSSRSSASL